MARRRSRRWPLGLWLGAALVAASVAQELRKPPSQRTWQGELFGIPYDYRPPTFERLRSTMWAPEDERVLKPRAFGIGRDLNLGRVVRVVSQTRSGASA